MFLSMRGWHCSHPKHTSTRPSFQSACAWGVAVYICMGMDTEVCIDMSIGEYADGCIDMDMCMDICMDMCMEMCIDIGIVICIDMCINMRIDMCRDM